MFTGLLSQVERWRAGRLFPHGAILSFHSITTATLPSCGDAHVSLETFKSFVRCLRRFGELTPLSEFVRRRMAGHETAGMIALTLDDGYAALAGEFREFIARETVPITIFVISRAAEDGETFWWDRLDDVHPRVRPDRWRAFEDACGLPESYRRGQPLEYGPLRPFRQFMLAAHAGRWPAHLDPALRALEEETGHQTAHRSMTFQELAALTTLPWVEIGVHTVSHPVLPLLSDADLEHEISGCYAALRDRCRAVVPVLAIPFGLFDQRVLRVARAVGMTTSLTLGGDIRHAPAPLALSRFCVTRSDTRAKLTMRMTGLPRVMRAWSGTRPALYPDLPSPTS